MTDYDSLLKDRNSAAEVHTKRAGYARGGSISDEKQDEKTVAAGVHKHERRLHKGATLTKLKNGGKVEGKTSMPRLDRKARGGGVHHKGAPKISVVVHAGGDEQAKQQALQQGLQMGAVMGAKAAAGAPRPPMAPQPGMMPPPGTGLPLGAPPPGGMPPPHPMMNKGGRIKLDAGAGGGMGRIEKHNAEGGERITVREHTRGRRG